MPTTINPERDPRGYHYVYPADDNSVVEYINERDTTETPDTVTKYKTVIVSGQPLRDNKMIFVNEMPDFFTEEELNTTYHSVEEYANSIKKYGLIYKTQKFENADTVEKLLEYATDWVKNNYHGGITSFDISALDMHMLGEVGLDKYTTGKRVDVIYTDPDTNSATHQTLTVISAEYDLLNPDRNQYKIGIPDSTLNKTYGESAKSGGGGGGKTVEDPSTDEETTEDQLANVVAGLGEADWALLYAENRPLPVGTVLPPSSRDQTSSKFYYVAGDGVSANYFEGAEVHVRSTNTNYLRADGSVDTDKLKANGISVKDIIKMGEQTVIEDSEDGVNVLAKVMNTDTLKLGDNCEVDESIMTDIMSVVGEGTGNPVDLIGDVISGEEFKISDSISLGSGGLTLGGYTLDTSKLGDITKFLNGTGVSIGGVTVDSTWINRVNDFISNT